MVAYSGFDLTAKAGSMTLEEAEGIIREAEQKGEIRTSSGRIQTRMEGATQMRLAATGGSGYVYMKEDQIPPGSDLKVGDAVQFGNSTERDLEIRTALWKKYKATSGSADSNGNGESPRRSARTTVSGFRLGGLTITDQPSKRALMNQAQAHLKEEVDKFWEAKEQAEAIARAADIEATLEKMKSMGVPDTKIQELREMLDSQIVAAVQSETVEKGDGDEESAEGAESEKEAAGRRR